MRRSVPVVVVAAVFACSHAAPPPAAEPPSPPFDATWRISTHNSYWVDHGVPDAFASGVRERLADQLLVDHARGVEIDIHKDAATRGAFDVYHTAPGNSLCGTLAGCLGELRAFHYALPEHEVVHVTLELKEITDSIFDDTHTIQDLDRELASELGPLLYRPADFMARCPGASTLSECALASGWPSTRELRGRFVVSPMGNWDGLGAQATLDFAVYATTGDVRERSGFPMASSWQLQQTALSGPIRQMVTQAQLDAAFAQSIFLQVEDPADPALPPFLARHGVVRIDGSVSVADQEARVALGAQLLQTDSPWVQYDDHGPSRPVRANGPSAEALTEPGSRLVLGPSAPGAGAAWVFAYRLEGAAGATAWEATIASGSDATRVGCLRAATSLAGETSLTACRTKTPAMRGTLGASLGSSPDAERAIVQVTVCKAGACETSEVTSNDPTADGPGDLVRIEVVNAESGLSCVQVRSAATTNVDLAPRWSAVRGACFTEPLRYQGIATPTSASFFGTRREAGGARGDVGAKTLTGVVAGTMGDGGLAVTVENAAPLLVDDSAPGP